MDFVDLSGFQPRTVDKVERLLNLLEEMGRHPDLRGRLAMHGGTALNLFMLNLPRLSVDIDMQLTERRNVARARSDSLT